MPEYSPTSRRPIANVFRATAHLAVRACLRLRISADAVSFASVVAAAIAGLMFWQSGRWPWLLLVAPLFCFIRLWLNMLDGMVAVAAKSASKRGEIVNEVPDRLSDILIFVGVAHSGWGHVAPAYAAALGAVMTAYIGVTGQAVAGKREYGGWMSKPWRMVVLALGAWVSFALFASGPRLLANDTVKPFDVACVIIIVGCIETCFVRLRATLRRLDAR
jgi:phosphatidylglycerophosphate synthase